MWHQTSEHLEHEKPSVMHEISGWRNGMRNTWHGDYHVSRCIKKGVLHLDQKEFSGGRNKNEEKRWKEEKEKGRGREVQHLLVSSVRTSKRFDGS